METLEHLWEQISIRHNLVSQIMFLGIVQGFFIAIILILRSRGKNTAFFLGLTFLWISIVFTDNYLCYTGLMKYLVHFNDSTEPIVLLIAPSFYLFLTTLIKRKQLGLSQIWYHFIFPLAYAFTQIPYYLAPVEVKINAYIGAYHSDLEYLPVAEGFNYSYHWIKDYFQWVVLLSFLFYAILGLILVREERHRIKQTPNKVNINRYIFSRNSILFLCLTFILALYVFSAYDDDSGDHYISMAITTIVYFTSYVLLVESRFFEKSWFADKYETLSNNELDFILVERALADNNYFLDSNISLKSLSEKIQVNKNTLSKAINLNTGMNFNDYINQKRVNVAKKRLLDEQYANLTVEGIGNSVGFNSKSAFYTAFKKHTNTSPSTYAKVNKS